MKKIIIADHVKQYIGLELYQVSENIEILTAYSNEDALIMHGKKKAHLIITELYGSGMNAVKFCSRIREDAELRPVSIIVFCNENEIELRESGKCRANAVMTFPIEKTLLRYNVQQFLSIPSRRDLRINFTACRWSRPTPQPFDCSLQNISVTGMLIEANADLSRGDRIQCTVALPEAALLEMQAEVVRAEKKEPGRDRNRFGVRFSRLDPTARLAIETLVAKNFSC